MTVIRIDDISVNTNYDKLKSIINFFTKLDSNISFLLGVSPLVFDMSNSKDKSKERIYPKILNAHSDFRDFYKVNQMGIPDYISELRHTPNISLASHSLIHVDHRLLTPSVQEVLILVSCSLINSQIFIPPFNKFDSATVDICVRNNIELIKFEDGWKHLLYTIFEIDSVSKYYFHTHDIDLGFLEDLFL